jgi:CBS domain-containing protein
MLRVRDLMATEVVTIGPDTDLRRAIEILVRHHVSGAPVVANDRVVGVVSATDLLEFIRDLPAATPAQPKTPEPPAAYYIEYWADPGVDVSARFHAVAASGWDRLGNHTVEEVMSRSLRAVRPDATVMSAADYLLRAGVHRVLVVDNRRLVGLLTTTDIVRAVAQGRLGEVGALPAGTVSQPA